MEAINHSINFGSTFFRCLFAGLARYGTCLMVEIPWSISLAAAHSL